MDDNSSSSSIPTIPPLSAEEESALSAPSLVEQAYREDLSLSARKSPEELADDAAANEHSRTQRFKNHFEVIAIVALYIAAIAITVIGGIWLWHMGAPAKMRWLSTEEVSHLQSIMTAGLLVSVIGQHFKKRMN